MFSYNVVFVVDSFVPTRNAQACLKHVLCVFVLYRVSADYNAPNKDQVFQFMDTAILKHGVNLIDTAEQYPIPSDGKIANEGDSELVIGEWMKSRGLEKGEGRRKVVVASKITGGR
jgi:aryl-alcohol dehydrogenase-like predicted oxidoreductase